MPALVALVSPSAPDTSLQEVLVLVSGRGSNVWLTDGSLLCERCVGATVALSVVGSCWLVERVTALFKRRRFPGVG